MSSTPATLFSQERTQGTNLETSEVTDSPPAKVHGNKSSSSGDEIIPKMRKPYTITKQRERWTDEEHKKFLEALKMYGRAWPRIEEHIGTKSAVQIRSHAQKFFSKLEREALARGIPMGEAQNISIPPPRPKRKPSNPYPRKAGTTLESGSSTIEQSSSSPKAVSFASHQISGGLSLADESQKNPSFAAYDSTAMLLGTSENIILQEKLVEVTRTNNSPSVVKLFGQMVLASTAQRGKTTTPKPRLQNNLQGAFQELTSVKPDISLECLTPGDQRWENGLGTKAQAKLHDEYAMTKTGCPSDDALNILPSESSTSMVEPCSGMNLDESCLRKQRELHKSCDQTDEQHHIILSHPRHVLVQHEVDGRVDKNIHKLHSYGPNVSSSVQHVAATSTLTNDSSLFNMSGSSLADIPSSSHSTYIPQLPCMSGPYNPFCSNVENFGHAKGFTSPGIASNGSFMLWHLLQVAALQHSTAYAAAALAAASQTGFVSGMYGETTAEPLRSNERMNEAIPWEKTNSAVSLVAATVAAASAWWALHGIVPPNFLQPGIYGPIPGATSATSSGNASPVCRPEPVIGAMEQRHMSAGDAKSLDAMPITCDADTEGNVTALQQSHEAKPLNPEGSDSTRSEPANCMPQGSSSDSDGDRSNCVRQFCVAEAHVNRKSSENGEHDQNECSTNPFNEKRTKIRKWLDRSSCDSNTPLSSDLEMNPYLGTNDEEFRIDNRNLDFPGLGSGASEAKEDTATDEEEMKGNILLGKAQRKNFNFLSKDEGILKAEKHIHKDDYHSLRGEAAIHRTKGAGNMNDIWKEVSEEGRRAFQALFAREILPQSFSSPHHLRNSTHPNFNRKQQEGIKQQPNKTCEDKMEVDFQHDAANPIQAYNDHDVHKQVMPALKTHRKVPISRSWEKNISDSELMVSDQSLPRCADSNLGKAVKLMSGSSFQNLRYGQVGFVSYKQCSTGTQINKPQMCSMENSEEHIREVKRICLEQEVNK